MEKPLNDLRDYMEKFDDMDNKYNGLKATLSNDTVEKFKEILKQEISKINDKLEGKLHQLCQYKNRIEPLRLLVKKQSSTVDENRRSTINRQGNFL